MSKTELERALFARRSPGGSGSRQIADRAPMRARTIYCLPVVSGVRGFQNVSQSEQIARVAVEPFRPPATRSASVVDTVPREIELL